MTPGSTVTFVERKGLEHSALVVNVYADEAEIMWASPDPSGRFRGKQGRYPFFKDGMTEKYVLPVGPKPPVAYATELSDEEALELAGQSPGVFQPISEKPEPIDTFKDATAGSPEVSTTETMAAQEEDNIDGMGPLQKGVQETLK